MTTVVPMTTIINSFERLSRVIKVMKFLASHQWSALDLC